MKTTITGTIHVSEEVACAINPTKPCAIISILSPAREGEKDRYSDLKEGWTSILRLWFHDISQPYQNYILFSKNDAKEIINFLLENKDMVSFVCVHCEAGISRSAAIAKFVSLLFNLTFDDRKGALYNRHIFYMLVDTAMDMGIIDSY